MTEWVKYVLDKIADWKYKPSASNIVFFTSGIIEFLGIVSLIAPFAISASFLDGITWKYNMCDDDLLLNLSFYGVLIHVATYLAREICVYIFRYKSNAKVRTIYSFVYSVDDLVELICSLLLLVFIMSAFLQIYYTASPFISRKSIALYIFVAYRAIKLTFNRYRAHNLKGIDTVLKNYSDLDNGV